MPVQARGPVRGFSLLELVVTLALVTVLTGLALPSLGRLIGGSEMTATVNGLVFSLQSARSEAIKRASPVALCTSAAPLAADPVCGGTGYTDGWIVYADANDNGKRDAGDPLEEVLLQHEPPGPAFTFTPDATVAKRVLFVDSGASATDGEARTPVSGSIRIDRASEDQARVVHVGANGRIASEVAR